MSDVMARTGSCFASSRAELNSFVAHGAVRSRWSDTARSRRSPPNCLSEDDSGSIAQPRSPRSPWPGMRVAGLISTRVADPSVEPGNEEAV